MNCYFITGTDTDSGKTVVSASLLRAFAAQEITTIAHKPVAAGCDQQDGEWRNSDALYLQAAASKSLSYAEVNPIALPQATAPHIAAALNQQQISVGQLLKTTEALRQQSAEVLLIEGAGGWQLPLNDTEVMPDYVRQTGAEVILVVGMKLGCLNHALLSVAAIKASGCRLAGWVANQPTAEQMPYYAENIAYLTAHLGAPCLAEFPHDRNWVTSALLLERAQQAITTLGVNPSKTDKTLNR